MTSQERDDLRATAESIVGDAERLKKIELRKLDLESSRDGAASPDDDEAEELATEAEQLAEDISAKAKMEKQLAENMTESA